MKKSAYIRLMMKKILEYINQYSMILTGDTIAVGVSGGADSVCLLVVLAGLREKIGFHIKAVHVNHGIRQEAFEDAEYVEKLCRTLGVELQILKENVKAVAAREHLSEEEAGRKVRYQAFENALIDCPYEKGKIAVAHHKNDRAETVLFHLFRGTGAVGLSGIRPVRGRIIRPLLCLERAEIETYLEKNNIKYCIDCTNAEDNYTRNKIRHHILSYAEREICAQTVEHINAAAQRLEETEQFLQKLTQMSYERIVAWEKGNAVIDAGQFMLEEKPLRERILLKTLERLIPGRKDVTSVHVEAVASLFNKEAHREIHLPQGIYAYRQYGTVVIGERRTKPRTGLPVVLDVPMNLELEDGSRLICSVFPYESDKNIVQKTYTKWFDYDKIVKSLILRTRQVGDYLTVNEEMSHKSLKEYMITEKIPRNNRDKILILAEEKHVLWVIGHRISAYYKVRPNTKNILQIEFIGGTKDV